MTFANIVQFCQDFRIVPRLATMHELLRAYSSAECLDYPDVPLEASEKTPPAEVKELSPLQLSIQEFVLLAISAYHDLDTANKAFNTSRHEQLSSTEFKNACSKIGFTGDVRAVYHELERLGAIHRQ